MRPDPAVWGSLATRGGLGKSHRAGAVRGRILTSYGRRWIDAARLVTSSGWLVSISRTGHPPATGCVTSSVHSSSILRVESKWPG